GDLIDKGFETIEINLDAIDTVLFARELEQGGRVAARHARDDCLFACHVDLFRQFRGIGTAVDGGREALEIHWNSAFPGKNAGSIRNPARSRGWVTYRQLRCTMTKGPPRARCFCQPTSLARAHGGGANPFPPPLLPCRNAHRVTRLHP